MEVTGQKSDGIDEELIPTRSSLLSRLKDWKDEASWKVFFDTYWKLIYSAAIKAGLSDAEAQDVVQETIMSVLKSLPTFDYNQEKGSFKGWLLRLTSWRILDQLRKRDQAAGHLETGALTGTRTATIERVEDPVGQRLEAEWDQEWETNLLEVALERVKNKVDPAHFQVFHLYVFKRWPVARVAQFFHMSRARVYLIKHRVGNLLKDEVAHLRAKPV